MSAVVHTVAMALGSAALLFAAEPVSAQLCATAEHRQFAFVIGNWLVRDSSGHVIGTTTLSQAYSGCVLLERWHGAAKAGEGLGVIGYQPGKGTWHRDFLDPSGSVVEIDGHVEGATMVMTGKDYPSDRVRMHRVTWAPRPDGTVLERWQTSMDAGESWQAHFYGVFERIAE